jgi:hypothetical protein
MQGASYDLLAGSSLALNQHGRFARRNQTDDACELEHAGALADHLVDDHR